MVPVMASTLLADTSCEYQTLTDSNESNVESVDDASSTGMGDDFDSSDFSSDGESASKRPATPTGICW